LLKIGDIKKETKIATNFAIHCGGKRRMRTGEMMRLKIKEFIDREYDAVTARYTVPLIWVVVLLPLILVGWNPAMIALAAVWCLLWLGLFAWRFPAWIKRLEVKERRAKRARLRRAGKP
jgi:hypothetical protein